MRNFVRIMALALGGAVLPAAAQAAVTYSFTQDLTGRGFSYTSPGFITGNVVAPAASVTPINLPAGYTLGEQRLLADPQALGLIYTDDLIGFLYNNGTDFVFTLDFFPNGSFGAAGTYSSGVGTLVVSGSPDAVPAAPAIALFGLGAAALLKRRAR